MSFLHFSSYSNYVSNEEARHRFIGDNLREEPFKKQIVNVHYQESYWRGEVLKKVGDLYSVRLIDLGLKVTVPLADMKYLDESLKSVRKK